MHGRFDEMRARTKAYARRLVWVLACALLIATVLVAERRGQSARSRDEPGKEATAATTLPSGTAATGVADAHSVTTPNASIGSIDKPAADTVVGPRIQLSGWALDASGIRDVELRIGGQAHKARYGIARPDVVAAKPGYPDAAPGFDLDVDATESLAASADGRRIAEIVAINRRGVETLLARKNVVLPTEASPWRSLYASRSGGETPPFYFLPGTSGITLGGAGEIDTAYAAYVSPTVRSGMRVPILYMRTTLGAKQDWRFDPDWDVERRCGERRIAEDSLNGVIAYARKHRIPVLFTLNGGVWSDASCGVPEWDATDHLERDKNNAQWNERGEVMDDDYLKHLAGAQESPELGRMLTYNVYAERPRHYKKRNLQAAARVLVEFARADPDLFVGVNLDPDTGLNPFFEQQQWYDYNPGTLRQFRHWLAGTGPYRGAGGPGVPDLRAYRRAQPLSLAEVNRLSGRAFRRWEDVDPPRSFALEGKPFWEDAWTHEWEVFRRHLIDLHYDELSQWLTQVGVPSDRIFSSQGFMAPHHKAMPFAVRIESPTKNYDSGGISVEGAVPSKGHLGAVIYGPAARNDIRMETPDSLFATFRRLDPGWGIVEFNTADLREPKQLPTYAMAYVALRDAFNFGARLISPMAWNGSNGIFAGQPGYVSYMAWRNTPLEEAMRDFAMSHAYVPLGTRLWTFGSDSYATTDGWTAETGASLRAGNGAVSIEAPSSEAALVSPSGLAIRSGELRSLVLGVDMPAAVQQIRVELRDASGRWVPAGSGRSGTLRTAAAGVIAPIEWPAGLEWAEQLRLTVTLSGQRKAFALRHVALYRETGGGAR